MSPEATVTGAPKIFCAVDTPNVERAKDLAGLLARKGLGIKLGLEFWSAQGPQGVRAVQAAAPGLALFLDLKFHDIPNTVAQAVRAATRLAPSYLNVHATGGLAMMRTAREAAADEARKLGIVVPRLLGVTVLTSMDAQALKQSGVNYDLETQVQGLTEIALEARLDGVVCSAHELDLLRSVFGPSIVTMVPGIRPAGSVADDQSRVMTPREALAAGATHLVIGRPITAAPDPAQAIDAILADLT